MSDGQSEAHEGSPMHGSLNWYKMRLRDMQRLLRLVHQHSQAADASYKGGNLWREVERELMG